MQNVNELMDDFWRSVWSGELFAGKQIAPPARFGPCDLYIDEVKVSAPTPLPDDGKWHRVEMHFTDTNGWAFMNTKANQVSVGHYLGTIAPSCN